jgi:peptidoglycan/xylan/chitin deacetylase (PgdA/CDA1 family)
MKIIFIYILTAVVSISGICQQGQSFHGKKCAVVLTYDDALNVHLDKVIPVLDSLGLKGTFYLTANAPGCTKRIDDWKQAAAKGHELGNHTLFHPCVGDQPGREFVIPEYNLNNYTVKRMVDEISMTNAFLQTLDGKTKRTFAFTCGDTKIHDTAFIDLVKENIVAARTVYPGMPQQKDVQLYNLPCYGINGHTGEQMIKLVNEAMKTNGLLIFLFHGVGGEHPINVSLEAHNELLHFLKQHENEIWIPTALELAEYINQQK